MNKPYNYSTKSQAKNLGHKRSTPINQSSLSGKRDNLQGLSVGMKVPMQMFANQPEKPAPKEMGRIQKAKSIKAATTRAAKSSSRFMGLSGKGKVI